MSNETKKLNDTIDKIFAGALLQYSQMIAQNPEKGNKPFKRAIFPAMYARLVLTACGPHGPDELEKFVGKSCELFNNVH